MVKGIQSFLNLANFYQKFIKGFLQMMKPLLDLFKKIKSFEWKEDQQKSIEDLKEKLLSTHDLKFPDFTKLFEVHTDVNNFAFERVLM